MSMFNKPTLTNNTVFSANQSLEAFFHSGVSLHKLLPGEYDARIHNFALVPANPSDPNSKPYIRIELQLLDDGRVVVDNRFQTGFQIMIDHLKDQLGMSDQDVAVQDLLHYCKQHKFTAYISYQEVEGKTYRNINYKAPQTTTTTTDQPTTEVVY